MEPERLTEDARMGSGLVHINCRRVPAHSHWLAIAVLLLSIGSPVLWAQTKTQTDSPSAIPAVTLAGDAVESGVQDREIITLILGLSAIPLIVFNWSSLMKIRGIWCWIAALIVREIAWVATVIEEFFLPQWLHALEHLCLTASTILLAIGAWIVFRPTASEVRDSPQ